MPTHLKALAVVLACSVLVFAFGKHVFAPYISSQDFKIRRNTWLAISIAAFGIPNFWLYCLVAAVIIRVAARRDSNPAALYMFLLLAAPPLQEDVPTFGLVNTLFYFDHLRLLSLVILLPLAFRQKPAGVDQDRRRFSAVDMCVVAYIVLQVVLLAPYQSPTATLRNALLLGIDIALPFFVISRFVRDRASIADAMASFTLAMMIVSPIAVFEMLKGWALYAQIAERWGLTDIIHYLTRGDYLRGQVSSGHSLVLGYNLAVGFGMWLYLQAGIPKKAFRALGFLTISAGLVGSLARGAWVGSLVAALAYFATGPRALSRLLKVFGVMIVVGTAAMASPWGSQIIDHLPFVGTVDSGNVVYRQRLAEVSWALIKQHPFFGSTDFLSQMEEMRQGEGIIDIVNVYASIALSFGFAGLACFVGAYGLSLLKCFRVVRLTAASDPGYAMLGASLIACMAAMMLMLGTVSTYLSIPYLNWSVIALSWAYWQMATPEHSWSAGQAPSNEALGGQAYQPRSW